jgi:peroxidase
MASAARNGAAAAAALMVAVSILALAAGGSAQLQYGFYRGKCNGTDVEAVVQSIVRARFARENPIVAYLLRMQFHECAVNVRVQQQVHCPRVFCAGLLIT